MNLSIMAALSGDADPELMGTLSRMEDEKRRKIETAVEALGENIASGYRYLKGEPKVVDSAGVEISPEDPRYAGIVLKYKQEQDIKFEALQNLIKGSVRVIIELMRPSALEAELMGRLLAGKKKSRRPSAGEARFND